MITKKKPLMFTKPTVGVVKTNAASTPSNTKDKDATDAKKNMPATANGIKKKGKGASFWAGKAAAGLAKK